MSRPGIRLVCLDIDGTLTDGVLGPPIPGTAEAVRQIRKRLPVRLVTNTTSVPHRVLTEDLKRKGFLDDSRELVTPVTVASRVLPGRGHARGILFAEPGAREDFRWFAEDPQGPAVLLATEGHSLRIADLQPAFRRLFEGATLYALQRNRYFRKRGEMRSEEHTSELQSPCNLVCRLLLEKKKKKIYRKRNKISIKKDINIHL